MHPECRHIMPNGYKCRSAALRHVKKGSLMLYGLQIASQNVEQGEPVLPRNTVIRLTHTKDGQELAPKDIVCDAPEDCANCDHRPICLKRRTMVGLYGGVEPLDEPTGNEDAEENEDGEEHDS